MSIELIVFACFVSLAWVISWLIAVTIYAALLRARHGATWTLRRRRALALVASIVGAGLITAVASSNMGHHRIREFADIIERWYGPTNMAVEVVANCVQMLCIGLLPVLLIGMAVQLYAQWAALRPSAGDVVAQDSHAKVRIGGVDLACAAALVVCGWVGFGREGIGLALVLSAAGLVSQHRIATLRTPAIASAATPIADLTPDRQRVLRLLEEGKINASECSELLGAMAQTMPTAMAIQPMTGPRRALVAGAVVVLVAFFLPWFTINPAAEAQRLMGSMRMFGASEATFSQPSMSFSGAAGTSGDITMCGGDMQHGLGWLMLALAAIAPAMPYVVPTLPASTRRTAMFLALAAGSVMGIYLVTSGWRWAEYGLWIALAGFALQWGAAIRESRA